jgi:hypothetical protein
MSLTLAISLALGNRAGQGAGAPVVPQNALTDHDGNHLVDHEGNYLIWV